MNKVTMKSETKMRENASDHQALLDIQELMDGVNWSPDTLDAIAEVLENAGYRVRDTDDTHTFTAVSVDNSDGNLPLGMPSPPAVKSLHDESACDGCDGNHND